MKPWQWPWRSTNGRGSGSPDTTLASWESYPALATAHVPSASLAITCLSMKAKERSALSSFKGEREEEEGIKKGKNNKYTVSAFLIFLHIKKYVSRILSDISTKLSQLEKKGRSFLIETLFVSTETGKGLINVENENNFSPIGKKLAKSHLLSSQYSIIKLLPYW